MTSNCQFHWLLFNPSLTKLFLGNWRCKHLLSSRHQFLTASMSTSQHCWFWSVHLSVPIILTCSLSSHSLLFLAVSHTPELSTFTPTDCHVYTVTAPGVYISQDMFASNRENVTGILRVDVCQITHIETPTTNQLAENVHVYKYLTLF